MIGRVVTDEQLEVGIPEPGWLRRHLPFLIGKQCPICAHKMERIPTPALLRPVRWLLPRFSSYRNCRICNIKVLTFHRAR